MFQSPDNLIAYDEMLRGLSYVVESSSFHDLAHNIAKLLCGLCTRFNNVILTLGVEIQLRSSHLRMCPQCFSRLTSHLIVPELAEHGFCRRNFAACLEL